MVWTGNILLDFDFFFYSKEEALLSLYERCVRERCAHISRLYNTRATFLSLSLSLSVVSDLLRVVVFSLRSLSFS